LIFSLKEGCFNQTEEGRETILLFGLESMSMIIGS